MTYPSIPITISWLRQLHYYYFWLVKHLIWFPRIRYDKPLTIIGIFTNMAVFPTGTTWNHLEPVGTSWNHLDPAGIWLDLVPVEPTGNSLLTGIQVENLEGVPCLFGRYPTQKILVRICLVLTGSGQNLWGTVKTSTCNQMFLVHPGNVCKIMVTTATIPE